MPYLKQSQCHKLAEHLFGEQCKLNSNEFGQCTIRIRHISKGTINWILLGQGRDWHIAFENAKENAKQIINKGKEEDSAKLTPGPEPAPPVEVRSDSNS